jgi:glutamate-1-semialdehyde 2,1-aminomutase
LSGNPLAVAAGSATLELLREPGVYERLERTGAALEGVLRDAAKSAGVALTVQRVGSMLTPFFSDREVRSWQDAERADRKRFARFHRSLLENGVYWPPSQFEAGFVSLAHDDAALEKTRDAVSIALRAL